MTEEQIKEEISILDWRIHVLLGYVPVIPAEMNSKDADALRQARWKAVDDQVKLLNERKVELIHQLPHVKHEADQ